MKKLLALALVLLMTVALLPMNVHTAKAEDYSGICGDHLSWAFDPDTGTLTISGAGPMYDYYLPENQPWSSYRDAILNISLPDGLSRVGQHAFWSCTNLTSITIPDSVKKIQSWAFSNCTGLAQIVLPDYMEDIASGAFSNCVSITAFSFPEGIWSVRQGVLNGATALASVSFPSTVTSIEPQAFSDCTSLFAITIPDTVTGIGYGAFYRCTGLTSITIPDSVTSIGSQAFAGCTSLTSFAVPANTTVIPYGLLSGCRDLISFSMHASVTEIGSDAFSDCTRLTTINIPDSVQIIGRNAFSGCTGLQTIVLPNGIETIQKCTFENCTALTHVGIPDSVVRIEDEAFRGCTSLVDITLPEGICFVGEDVFYDTGYWNSFDKAVIYLGNVLLGYVGYSPETFISASMREGTRVVAGGAFENCTQIDQIIFPDTVVGIGANAYRNCTGVERIAISDSTLYIGEGAFYNCTALDSLTIPCSAQIGNNVFAGCSNLSTVNITAGTGTWENADGAWLPSDVSFAVKIEHGVTRIGNNAFSGCEELTSIIIPSTVSDIGSKAFYNCGRLTELTIPESVTSIGDAAFSDCWRLKTVNLPDGIERLGDSLFEYCTSLSDIAIPESVRSIGEEAFLCCRSLESITIPDGITSISDRTFADCMNLRELSLPDSVRFIGISAFSNCRKLGNFELPDHLDKVFDGAFESCVSITRLVIPQSTTYVGDGAFASCTSLTEVSIPSSILIDSAAFMDCTSLSDIRIGERVSVGISAFKNTAYWNGQSDGLVYLDYILLGYKGMCTETSITVAESTRSIAAGAFDSCSTLEEVYLPNGITSIRERTFSQCSSLTSIEIPESVEKIGSYAFYNCSGLITVTFCGSEPEIREVARDAFLKCSSLTDVYYGGLEEQCRINDQYPYNTCETLLYCSWHYQTASAASGQCGDDLYWSFDKETGTLTITGSGDMWDNECGAMPWEDVTVEYVDSYGGAVLRDDPTVSLIHYIILPEGLTSIASGAFCGTLIESIEIPSTVKSILYMAFASCENLKSIAIPDGISKITWQCFSNCGQLESVTLPVSVTEVYEGAFWDCNAITDVYYQGTAEQRAEMTFGDDNEPLLNATWHYLAKAIEGVIEWNTEDVQFKGSTPYVIENGSAQTPRFTVKNSADGSVIDPANYDYEYKENTNAGTGYVIVTFKGDYSGTAQGWFKIYLPATEHTYVENVSNGIKVTWDPVEGAAGYVIYRRAWSSTTNGWTTFERWNNTTDTTYIDGADANHKVYAGSRYQYGVKAYFARRTDPVSGAAIGGNVGDNYNLGEVGPLKTTVRITTRKLVQVRPGSGTMTVKWEASKNFTGYQIKYATDANFTKNVVAFKIGDPTTYWTTIKGLKSNTTYYVCIRSYHEFNGMTYFGEWSNVLSGKVK